MGLLDKKACRNDGIAWRIIEEEALLVNPTAGHIFPLDGVGTRIWELIDGERTVGQIARQITEEFEADVATVERDVEEFAGRLAAEGLVTVYD